MKKLFLSLFLFLFIRLEAQWINIGGPYSPGFYGFCFATTKTSENYSSLFMGSLYGEGIYLSTDQGLTWTKKNVGLTTTVILSLQTIGDTIIAGTYKGVFISTDNGSSWLERNNGLGNNAIYSLTVIDKYIFAGTSTHIYRTSDNGISWTQVSGVGLFVRSDAPLQTLAHFNTILIAGTNTGLFTSSDYGENWSERKFFGDVYSITTKGANIYASTYASKGGVYKSTDNGSSWSTVNNGLPNMVSAIYSYGSFLLAGTWKGIFISLDEGISWQSFSNQDYNEIPDCSAFIVSDNYIFAGSSFIWRRPLLDIPTSVDFSSVIVPTIFELGQNYPNPFNPKTSINYSIPEACFVTIKVYDLLGKEVVTLLNENKSIGNYKVEFDGSKFVSGVYFYQLKAGNFSETKKMLLMK